MSADKLADSQKKLELATNVVIAFINASGKPAAGSDKTEKTSGKTEIVLNEKQILHLLEKTYNKMHELVPLQERKIGLGH